MEGYSSIPYGRQNQNQKPVYFDFDFDLSVLWHRKRVFLMPIFFDRPHRSKKEAANFAR